MFLDMIVPTLRVGMHQWTLCVRIGTQSVPGCIPTQSVGTIVGASLLAKGATRSGVRPRKTCRYGY
ncbi:hypothetical protein FGA82_28410 [Pseudomonas fluorescens]|nr:hypothetical protein FGA82_28410 [Pseudomonas fluorescens]